MIWSDLVDFELIVLRYRTQVESSDGSTFKPEHRHHAMLAAPTGAGVPGAFPMWAPIPPLRQPIQNGTLRHVLRNLYRVPPSHDVCGFALLHLPMPMHRRPRPNHGKLEGGNLCSGPWGERLKSIAADRTALGAVRIPFC